jgi:hypothetical protein
MSSTQSTLRDIDRRYAGAPAVATDVARETTGQIGARLDRLPATRTIWSLVVLISLGGSSSSTSCSRQRTSHRASSVQDCCMPRRAAF